MQHYFKGCAPLPHNIVGCATSAQHAAPELKSLKVVVASPPQLVFAYTFAVKRYLGKGDDRLLAAWRRTMLACPIEFHMCGSPDERHKFAFQYKENLAEIYARKRFTTVQKM